MIEGPGFPAGRKVEGVTSNADLARTILDIAGAKPKRGFKLDGMSLLKAAGDPKGVLADRGVFIETAPNPRGVPTYIAVRTKRYRYDLQEDGQEGLYDLKERSLGARERPRRSPLRPDQDDPSRRRRGPRRLRRRLLSQAGPAAAPARR